MRTCPHPTCSLGCPQTILWLAVSGMALLFSLAGFAQMNTGQIAGIVKDPSGDVISSASVTATEQGTQRKFTALTNESGQYLLPQLAVGEYALQVDAPGFKQAL